MCQCIWYTSFVKPANGDTVVFMTIYGLSAVWGILIPSPISVYCVCLRTQPPFRTSSNARENEIVEYMSMGNSFVLYERTP